MRARSTVPHALAACLLLGACNPDKSTQSDATTAATPPSVSVTVVPSAPPPVARPSSSVELAQAPSTPPSGSASAHLPPVASLPPPAADCEPLLPPAPLSLTGPLLLLPQSDGPPRIIANEDGVAKTLALSGAAPAAPPAKSTTPACVASPDYLFCMSQAGDVRRSRLNGEDASVVAKAHPVTSLSAAAFGPNDTVVVFLADRATTEGVVMAAFAKRGDYPPIMLSEDGSGATYVTVAPWNGRLLVMYLDERRAMTPVHARIVSADDSLPSGLSFGRDAVIFVGEAGGSRMTGALALSPAGPGYALVPSVRDSGNFGLAAIQIDDPPIDDADATWSLYPSHPGVAPVAATRGLLPPRALRVRPAEKSDGGKVLELGRIAEKGHFYPTCEITKGSSITDPAIVGDAEGALWLSYSTGGRTFVERRGAKAR